MTNSKTALTTALALTTAGIASLSAQLVPIDVPNLDIWLTDAGNSFDGTTWSDSSGNNNDATAVGFRAANGSNAAATYAAGTASTQFSTAGVAFASGADDLMSAGGSYNGATAMTIFTVYSVSAPSSLVRPAGFGSQAAKGAGTSDIFNLATDGSLRYDNGNTDTGVDNPANTFLVRAVKFNGGDVAEWIDTAGSTFSGAGKFSASGQASSPLGPDADALYLGDVRAGDTVVGGFTGLSDIFISQIAVYDRALTDQEMIDVANWMSQNPGAVPEPSTYALIGGLLAFAGVLIRRKRS